jgi:lipopolysaccharide transport protein LptA
MIRINFISKAKNMIFVVLGFCLLSSNCYSQEINKNNRNPIKLSADEGVLDKESGGLNFSGNVKVFFKGFEINSDRITAEQDIRLPKNKIRLIEATGNVLITNHKDIYAKGDNLTFDVKKQLILLKGNVKFRRGDSTLQGKSVSFDLLTENIEFDGRISAYVFN